MEMHDKLDEIKSAVNDRKVLLVVTVEIGKGGFEDIAIREGDSAEELSANFCQDHCLPTQLIAPLKQHITNKLLSIRRESKSKGVKEKAWGYAPETNKVIKDNKSPKANAPSFSGKSTSQQADTSIRDATFGKIFEPEIFSQHLFAPTIASSAKAAAPSQQFQMRDVRPDQVLCREIARKMMWISRSKAKQYQNYGEFLYQEGVAKQQEKLRLSEKKRKENEVKEVEFLSFTPKISTLAKQVQRGEKNVWKRLSYQKDDDCVKRLHSEIWQIRLKECTFVPNLCHQNVKQDKSCSYLKTNQDCFDKLFLDAQSRQDRLMCYINYEPNRVTSCSSMGRQGHPNKFDAAENLHGGSVYNRLVSYAAKIAEKRKKMEDQTTTTLILMPDLQQFKSLSDDKQQAKVKTAPLPIKGFLYRRNFKIECKRNLSSRRLGWERLKLPNTSHGGKQSVKLRHPEKSGLTHISKYLDVDKVYLLLKDCSHCFVVSKDVPRSKLLLAY